MYIFLQNLLILKTTYYLLSLSLSPSLSLSLYIYIYVYISGHSYLRF